MENEESMMSYEDPYELSECGRAFSGQLHFILCHRKLVGKNKTH